MADTVSHLSDRYENMRARVGMREVRAARDAKPNGVDALTGQSWKDAKRKELGLTLTPAAKPKE